MANEIQPIPRDQNGPRGVFYKGDAWLGPNPIPPSHPGRYVLKEDDIVYDFAENGTKTEERCTYVDGEGKPTLVKLRASSELGGDEEDVFRGSDLAAEEDLIRCFINSANNPFQLSIDSRLELHGDDLSHYRVYKGIITEGSEAVCISALYNTAGSIVSQNLPLLTPVGAPGNYAGKYPGPGYSTHNLGTGSVVTVVAYSADDQVRRMRRMSVENTNFLVSTENNKRLITDIRLISPFLSVNDPNVLEYPVNITMDTAQLYGRVTYTNGQEIIPVDGTRFQILGLSNSIFTSATEGQEITLMYHMSNDEEAYSVQGVTLNRGIAKSYRLRGVEYPGAYNVKLFVYPEWVDAVTGYRLRYWLHNIDRRTVLDVTGYVQLAENSEPFKPKTYGVLQSLRIALDLSTVDPNYRPIRHIQTVGIVLAAAGNTSQVPRWTVFYHETQAPAYGVKAIARIQHVTANSYTLDISSGYATQETWLRGLYFDTFPLMGGQEAAPPYPTNFTVMLPTGAVDYAVSQWNAVLNMAGAFEQGRLVVIHFWRTMGSERIQLATAALPVHRV